MSRNTTRKTACSMPAYGSLGSETRVFKSMRRDPRDRYPANQAEVRFAPPCRRSSPSGLVLSPVRRLRIHRVKRLNRNQNCNRECRGNNLLNKSNPRTPARCRGNIGLDSGISDGAYREMPKPDQ